MITFISYTENVRKINDWGREEDKDVHIGLDEKTVDFEKNLPSFLVGVFL